MAKQYYLVKYKCNGMIGYRSAFVETVERAYEGVRRVVEAVEDSIIDLELLECWVTVRPSYRSNGDNLLVEYFAGGSTKKVLWCVVAACSPRAAADYVIAQNGGPGACYAGRIFRLVDVRAVAEVLT